MSRVTFVHGSYYNKNFGDYLLLKIVQDELTSDSEVVFPFSRSIVRTDFKGSTRKVKLSDFFNAKVCIFGGGGYLGEPPKNVTKWSINFIWRHFLPFLVLRTFGIKVKIIGAGFGPISKTWLKPLVKIMLKSADKVMLRDIESINYAKSICFSVDYTLVTDLAQNEGYLNELIGKHNIKEEKNYIAFHAGLAIEGEEGKALYTKVEEMCHSGMHITVFSDSPAHNKEVQDKKLLSLLGLDFGEKISFVEYTNPESVLKVIKNSCGVITGKLHVGIVASTFGKPVLSIPLHHKTIRYYRDINRVDSCWTSAEGINSLNNKIELFISDINSVERFYLPDHVINRHKLAMDNIKSE